MAVGDLLPRSSYGDADLTAGLGTLSPGSFDRIVFHS